jgi:hypothetical protein
MQEMVDHVQEIHPGLDLKDIITPSHVGYTMFITNRVKGSTMFVLIKLRDDKDYPTMYDTIVHEAVHLSWAIIDQVGVGINQDNHETQAYLVENLNNEIKEVVSNAREKFAIDAANTDTTP